MNVTAEISGTSLFQKKRLYSCDKTFLFEVIKAVATKDKTFGKGFVFKAWASDTRANFCQRYHVHSEPEIKSEPKDDEEEEEEEEEEEGGGGGCREPDACLQPVAYCTVC